MRHSTVASAIALAALTAFGIGSADARGAELRLRAPAGAADARHAGRAPDTVGLLLLLVQFPADNDPTTTGDGRFQLDPDETYATNRPPHDHTYFDLQTDALARYFRAASEGRLEITWTLFPPVPLARGAPAFLEMPREMRFYNPDTTDAALDERLAAFFRDAILAGDAAGAPFSSHEHVAIFHAGVGQDLLIGDTTPSDLPSAFLSLDELRSGLSEDESFIGIPVEGGAHVVSDGFWLPETENQEGIEFALLGVFAQLMGSQLGLPILFNPDSGAPGIGRFGLMDQGGGNLFGFVPSFPCAWSRLDRGWAEATTVRNGANVALRAVGALEAGAELVVIPVDEREYFLLENRKKERNGDGELVIEHADPTVRNVPIGVTADEYDYGIPGSGILVWHIDQSVIDRERAANRVNADFTHRGVKLLEADGLDDIGLRPQGGFGLPEDCFFRGNADTITPTTTPSTRSNYGGGADTHVFVTSISDTGSVMTFDVTNDLVLSGWPDISSPNAYGGVSPALGDVDQDGQAELVVAAGSEIRVYGTDGTLEATHVHPDGIVANAVAIEALLVANVADDACEGCERIAVAGANGGVRVYRGDFTVAFELPPGPAVARGTVPVAMTASAIARDTDAIRDARALYVARGDSAFVLGDLPDAGVSPLDVSFYEGETAYFAGLFGTMDDVTSLLVSRDGHIVAFPTESVTDTGRPVHGAPVVGDLSGDGVADVVWAMPDGRVVAFGWAKGSFVPLGGFPSGPLDAASPLALGDVDADGRLDVVFGGRNRVHAIAGNGIRLEGWPVTLSRFGDGAPVRSQPLVFSGDPGGPAMVVAAPDGVVRSFDGRGGPLSGGTFPAGKTHVLTPIAAPVGAGALFLAGSGSTWVHGFVFPGAGEAVWGQLGGDRGRSGVFDPARLRAPTDPPDFLPEDDLYVYPNPAHDVARVRYFLGKNARVRVSIFDLAGQVVRRLEGVATGGVMNETFWDLRNDANGRVSPGLYVVRVAATDGGRETTIETKVAVY